MEENKKKEPKLRVIKAPQSVEPFVNSTSNTGYGCGWSGGGGTSPEDCMSYENYLILCKNGALESEVYVCGSGKKGPNSKDCIKECISYVEYLFLCRNNLIKSKVKVCGSGMKGPEDEDCKSVGSSGSSSSSSGSSGSSGYNTDDLIITADGYDWESWSGWYSGGYEWNDFSGSSWYYNAGSGMPIEQQKSQLKYAASQASAKYGKTFEVVLSDYPYSEKFAIEYGNGKVVVYNEFFSYYSGDQESMLWYAFYCMDHGYDEPVSMNNLLKIVYRVILQPSGDLQKCLEKQLQTSKLGGTYETRKKEETEYTTLYPSKWYRNRLEACKAEMKNGIYKSERYLCEKRWTMWKYESLAYAAEREEDRRGYV